MFPNCYTAYMIYKIRSRCHDKWSLKQQWSPTPTMVPPLAWGYRSTYCLLHGVESFFNWNSIPCVLVFLLVPGSYPPRLPGSASLGSLLHFFTQALSALQQAKGSDRLCLSFSHHGHRGTGLSLGFRSTPWISLQTGWCFCLLLTCVECT